MTTLLRLNVNFRPSFAKQRGIFVTNRLLNVRIRRVRRLVTRVRDFTRVNSTVSRPIHACSDNVRVHLTFDITATHHPSVLVISRTLSINSTCFRRGDFSHVHGFHGTNAALLVISRSHSTVRSVYSATVLLRNKHVTVHNGPRRIVSCCGTVLTRHRNRAIHRRVLTGNRIRAVSNANRTKVLDIHLLSTRNHSIRITRINRPVILRIRTRIHRSVRQLVLKFVVGSHLNRTVCNVGARHLSGTVASLATNRHIAFQFTFSVHLNGNGCSVTLDLSQLSSRLSHGFR